MMMQLLVMLLPLLLASVAWCRALEMGGWSGTKPVLVATGDPPRLAQFPSSLNRFGTSKSLLLIAQGNSDVEMPKGGFGREFASYDDGMSWHEVGPPRPSDGSPRKGVACIPSASQAAKQLTCIPFRLQINEAVDGNRSGVVESLTWHGGNSTSNPTKVADSVNVTVRLSVSGGFIAGHADRWGLVPDMATPLRVKRSGAEAWFLTLYGQVYIGHNYVALGFGSLVSDSVRAGERIERDRWAGFRRWLELG